MRTLEAKAALRWNWPHGINGPKVLQQAWMCHQDGSIEWEDVPNNIPELISSNNKDVAE